MNLFAIWMVQFCFCIQRNLRSRTMAGRCLFYKKLPKFLLLPRSSTTTKQSTIHNILQDTFWRPLNNFVRMNLGVPFSTYLQRPISPVIRPRPDLRYCVLESSFCFVSVPGKLLLWLLCCPSRPNKTLYKGEIPNCIANCRNAFLMIGLRYQIRRHRPNIPL